MASQTLPEPMRVLDDVIARCRREVEGSLKRNVRKALIPFIKARTGFAEMGEGFQWGFPLDYPRGQTRAGRYVYIGAHGLSSGPVVLGDLTMISSHVKVFGNDHLADVVGSPTRLEFAPDHLLTVFEADTWIGQGAMIREGVTIGRGAIVAAGSIVTRSVAPYDIVAGAPARPIRRRFTPQEIEAHDIALYGRSMDATA